MCESRRVVVGGVELTDLGLRREGCEGGGLTKSEQRQTSPGWAAWHIMQLKSYKHNRHVRHATLVLNSSSLTWCYFSEPFAPPRRIDVGALQAVRGPIMWGFTTDL